MINLYYVVEKQLVSHDPNGGTEETTGNKDITIYNIDTQSMNLVVFGEFETANENNSEDACQLWLEANKEDVICKLIKL